MISIIDENSKTVFLSSLINNNNNVATDNNTFYSVSELITCYNVSGFSQVQVRIFPGRPNNNNKYLYLDNQIIYK